MLLLADFGVVGRSDAAAMAAAEYLTEEGCVGILGAWASTGHLNQGAFSELHYTARLHLGCDCKRPSGRPVTAIGE